MKAKKLAFPFISFSESGLFNGLQPIQIKKCRPQYLQSVSAISSFRDPDKSDEQEQDSTHSEFKQNNVCPRPAGDDFWAGSTSFHRWRWWPSQGDAVRTGAAETKADQAGRAPV
jgi:hypothetical protein